VRKSKTPIRSKLSSAASPKLSPNKNDRAKLLQHGSPPQKLFTTANHKPTKAKLFDVDVKIAKDTVVRLELSEGDDPWVVSKHF